VVREYLEDLEDRYRATQALDRLVQIAVDPVWRAAAAATKELSEIRKKEAAATQAIADAYADRTALFRDALLPRLLPVLIIFFFVLVAALAIDLGVPVPHLWGVVMIRSRPAVFGGSDWLDALATRTAAASHTKVLLDTNLAPVSVLYDPAGTTEPPSPVTAAIGKLVKPTVYVQSDLGTRIFAPYGRATRNNETPLLVATGALIVLAGIGLVKLLG